MEKSPEDIALLKARKINTEIAKRLAEEAKRDGKSLPERDLSSPGPISLAEYPELLIIERIRRQRLLGERSRDTFTLITDLYLERMWGQTLKELKDKGLIG